MRTEELKALCEKHPISIPIREAAKFLGVSEDGSVLPVCRADVLLDSRGPPREQSVLDSRSRRWHSSAG